MQTKEIKKEDRSLHPIGVFWDIENCQVPRGKSATALVGRIRQLFFSGHAEAEFLCVCDIRKERPEVVQELNLAQVTVVHINATSKNAADDKLKQCMRRYVDIHGSPATLMLISGDVNFSTELSDFRHRRQIRVVILHGSSAPEALTACAHECYSFAEVAAGVPFRTPQPKGQPRCCELVVQDLPTDKEYSLVHNRLRQLSDNCGGRVLSIAGPRAVLRFPTPDAALRASKRMDGEDVFGSTIAVGLHDTRRRRSRGLRAGSKRSSSSSTSRSPESSSAEADSYHLFSSHRESGGFEIDTWHPEGLAKSLPGLEAEANPEAKKSRSVGRVSPFFRCSSQPEVLTTHHVSGEVAAMSLLSLRTSSVSPGPRLCASAKSSHLHGRATSEHGSSSGGGVERPRIRPRPQGSPGDMAPRSPRGQKNSPAKANLQDSSAQLEAGPVEVHITNLDPRIEATELKKMLLAVFQEHVTVLHVSLLLQPDSSLRASVRVPSVTDARKAVECLHQRRLGLHCLHLSFDEAELPSASQQQTTEPVYCALHYNPTSASTVSSSTSALSSSSPWALWVAVPAPLPEMSLGRTDWIARLGSLLDSHTGSLPLDSFQACYEAEFGPLPVAPLSEPWKEGSVPLEHLVLSTPGVNIVTSPQGFKRAMREPVESRHTSRSKGGVKGSSLPALEELSREMVELLSGQPRCSLPLHRFIPAYHRHFGRQCRLADYGCTKLLDLLAAIGHVVEILGYGHTRVLTLTHEAQMKRFAVDIRRLFGQADGPKSLLLSSLPHHFREVHQRPLEVADYGACNLDNLLEALPKSVLVVEQRDGNTVLTVPERVPTAEEAERLRQFAKELVLLLGSTGSSGLLLSQLSPAYQQQFGRKLRAAEYGPFRKLLPLLQAIPDVAQVYGAGNRRMVRLAPGYQLPTPADSKDHLTSPTPPPQSPVDNREVLKGTEEERQKRQEEESLLDLLSEQPGGGLDLGQLWDAFHARCGSYPSMPLLRHLEARGYISLDRKASRMRLSPRHLLTRQLRRLLLSHESLHPSLPLARLEETYRERHGAPPPICQLGFPCLEGFLLSLPEYFNLSGTQEAQCVSLVDTDTLNSSTQHGTQGKLAPEEGEEVSSEPATTASCPVISLEVDASAAGCSENGSEPELLKLCPDDLLDRPIPSGIPSPDIRPEVSPAAGSVTAETTDLMQFDQADCAAGSSVAVVSAKLFDPITASAAPRARRRIAAFFPMPLAQ